MPVKIRLTRQGRKKRPIYHIVVADSRAPRDGKIIERLGQFDPNQNPATIDLNFERALDWLQKGAQPTDTCRSILSLKGVLIKKHLLEGVKKGAFSEDEANTRFDKWMKEKEAKFQAQADRVKKASDAEAKKRLESESKIREAMAEEISKKKEAELKKAEKEEAENKADEAPVQEEATSGETEAVAEETPAGEAVVEETPADEVETEETPADEAVAEEAPAEQQPEASSEETSENSEEKTE